MGKVAKISGGALVALTMLAALPANAAVTGSQGLYGAGNVRAASVSLREPGDTRPMRPPY